MGFEGGKPKERAEERKKKPRLKRKKTKVSGVPSLERQTNRLGGRVQKRKSRKIGGGDEFESKTRVNEKGLGRKKVRISRQPPEKKIEMAEWPVNREKGENVGR